MENEDSKSLCRVPTVVDIVRVAPRVSPPHVAPPYVSPPPRVAPRVSLPRVSPPRRVAPPRVAPARVSPALPMLRCMLALSQKLP